MKYNATKIYFNSWCLLLLSALLSCSGSPEEKRSNEFRKVETPSTSSQEYYINNPQNIMLASIKLEDAETWVIIGDEQYYGELKSTEKRKYYNQSDALIYTVKYSESGFKLRDSNETLLWKIKITNDYIKLANNEEMNNPYRISMSDNKIKIKKDEVEVSKLRLESGNQPITLEDKYQLINFGGTITPGIILLQDISEEHRFMICAELLRLKK